VHEYAAECVRRASRAVFALVVIKADRSNWRCRDKRGIIFSDKVGRLWSQQLTERVQSVGFLIAIIKSLENLSDISVTRTWCDPSTRNSADLPTHCDLSPSIPSIAYLFSDPHVYSCDICINNDQRAYLRWLSQLNLIRAESSRANKRYSAGLPFDSRRATFVICSSLTELRDYLRGRIQIAGIAIWKAICDLRSAIFRRGKTVPYFVIRNMPTPRTLRLIISFAHADPAWLYRLAG